MQMDKLTLKSQEALQEAQRIAHGYSHQKVDANTSARAHRAGGQLDSGFAGKIGVRRLLEAIRTRIARAIKSSTARDAFSARA